MPRTYDELELYVCEQSEWADTHILEALTEEAFEELYAEVEPTYPYGRGFTEPMFGEVGR